MKHVDSKKIVYLLVKFLKESFRNANFSRGVIALSGGVDSSVSFVLSVLALGKENVFPILLPYGVLDPQGEIDALRIVKMLNIPDSNITRINIKDFVDKIAGYDFGMDPIRYGNIMARVRMTLIFDQAKKRKALVIGTENKSEHLLGYFTRFGDEASDIEPLRNLYKTTVYQIAKSLRIPEQITTKKPTAGLWKGQTDEDEFGFTYKEADKILYYFFDKKLTITEMIVKGLQKPTIEKVLAFAKKNGFKHTLPIVLNLSVVKP